MNIEEKKIISTELQSSDKLYGLNTELINDQTNSIVIVLLKPQSINILDESSEKNLVKSDNFIKDSFSINHLIVLSLFEIKSKYKIFIVKSDVNWFYRAIALNVYKNKNFHKVIRENIIKFALDNLNWYPAEILALLLIQKKILILQCRADISSRI